MGRVREKDTSKIEVTKMLGQEIISLTAKLERAKEGLFKIDRAANGNRKDKAARISELARQALKDIEND